MRMLKILGSALITLGMCASVNAQDKPKTLDELRAQGYSVKSITPIYSQLLLTGYPQGFQTAYEKVNGPSYIRELVPVGESVDNWTKMMTISGIKGLASKADITPKIVLSNMAGGFKRACPNSFSAQVVTEGKLSGFDSFVAVVSCGVSPATGGKSSETALIAVIKGQSDYYTIQWAERSAPSNEPIALDVPTWAGKLSLMSPIKLCPIVPGEQAPYPSCVGP